MSYALPFVVFAVLALFVAPWVAAFMVLVALILALVETVLIDDAAADRERVVPR